MLGTPNDSSTSCEFAVTAWLPSIAGVPHPLTMASRSVLARNAQLAFRRSGCVPTQQRRGFAAAASSSSSFETSEVGGIKVASRDAHGPTTKLAVVAKAGTRYQPLPGLTVGLEEFAFKVRLPGLEAGD